MLQPFKLVDELGRYQAMARMDWEQADKENRALRDKGNGRRWVPDHDKWMAARDAYRAATEAR